MSEQIQDIKLNKIIVDSAFNCRGIIRPLDVTDLVKSIDNVGLQTPVLVTPLNNEYVDECKKAGVVIPYEAEYFLIAGFRRHRAIEILNQRSPEDFPAIPCIVRDIKYRDATLLNLTENLARQDLNVVQESNGLRRMYDSGYTRQETADMLNKTPGWVQIRFMILALPSEIYPDIISGAIKQTDVRLLYSLWNLKRNRENCSYEESKQELFQYAKSIKEANQRGNVAPKKTKTQIKKEKKVQTRSEILDVQTFIYKEYDGPNPFCDAMAWCAGEITLEDLLNRASKELDIDCNKYYEQ